MFRIREPVAVLWLSHGMKPFCERLSVAIGASGRHLGTTRSRVPGSLGPLNPRPYSHVTSSDSIALLFVFARLSSRSRFYEPSSTNDYDN